MSETMVPSPGEGVVAGFRDLFRADLEAQADALEHRMARELDAVVVQRSSLFTSGDVDPRLYVPTPPPAGRRWLMGDDPRLPAMPPEPTLTDFFRYRFGPAAHLLQSADVALRAGYDDKVVLACLLHDISMIGFIRPDHGYWAAQLLAPYVDPEVAWAVRMHQVLRFFPDDSVGYEYPEMYTAFLGADYVPPRHVVQEYERARRHRWYMTARLITLNDTYSFDAGRAVELDQFTDVIGRHFRQPREGLGFDGSASAHMWRTIIWPTRAL